jgi:hypothetical protein
VTTLGSIRYRIYGLVIDSSLPLPGAPSDRARPDVWVREGRASEFAAWRAEAAVPRGRAEWFVGRRLADGSRYVKWAGLFEFHVSHDGRHIRYRRLSAASAESFAAYLLGHVLSFSLLASGRETLHGTVVVAGGHAAALVAPCGAGKSTLAAALIGRGYRVLTDDLIVLARGRAGWMVQPGLPRLKLYPSIAHRLGGTGGAAPLNRATSKLILPLDDAQACHRPTPLTRIYVLPDADSASRPSQVSVEPLIGAEALLEVVRGAFNLVVLDRDRLEQQFRFAGEVTRTVGLRRLSYSRRLSALPDVCDAVAADLAAGSGAMYSRSHISRPTRSASAQVTTQSSLRAAAPSR